MCVIGKNAYILPEEYVSIKHNFAPYIFTDEELRHLFSAIDRIRPTIAEPFIHVIAPVLFRLIYTCGLRPNEEGELKCENEHLDTGEILVTNTKKKERLVVMSEDMCSLMRSYRVERATFGQGNDYWFPSAKGGTLTSEFQTRIFKNSWAEANPGIPKKGLPAVRVYDLRHRFASAALIRWLDKGGFFESEAALSAGICRTQQFTGNLRLHPYPAGKSDAVSAIDWPVFYDLLPEVRNG